MRWQKPLEWSEKIKKELNDFFMKNTEKPNFKEVPPEDLEACMKVRLEMASQRRLKNIEILERVVPLEYIYSEYDIWTDALNIVVTILRGKDKDFAPLKSILNHYEGQDRKIYREVLSNIVDNVGAFNAECEKFEKTNDK